MTQLADRHCRPGAPRLSAELLSELLQQIPQWRTDGDVERIERSFRFANYYETIAFVNALALIAHRQDHHPELSVHYNRVIVSFTTHDAGGLTENDLICAARIDALRGESQP